MSTLDRLKNSFKNELITKRAELELSQEKMAERLDISLHSYSDLERGNSFCSAVSLINFVNNCNVDKDKLFTMFDEIINDTKDN
ncbi:MAG: helix-turn-helix domain-containing protein [Eubacterium sp.]|nr:helix-turn-helix domain-containing protein [Eubacterium sp.]